MAYIDFNAHRFSMSKGSRRPRKPSKPKEPWKKPQWMILWRRTLLIILGVIGLLTALYFGYRQLKKYQVRRLDRQALAYLRAGKVKEARMSLLGALRLNPVDPVALHLQVRVQEATGENVQALASYERLARSGKLSLTDLRPYALLAARQGQNDQADRLATIAGKNYPVLGHQIRADLLLLNKQPAEAAKELRTAISTTPDADSEKADPARRDLVQLILKYGPEIPSADPSTKTEKTEKTQNAAEALSLMTLIGSRASEAGPQALASAIQMGLVPRNDLPAWVAKLRSHPKVTPEMQLLADATSIQLDPSSKSAVVAGMLERLKKENLETRIAGARLLLSLREPSQAANLITRDEAFQSPALFNFWMNIQDQDGNSQAILDALALPKNPFPPYLRDLYRGAVLKMKKENAAQAKEIFAKVLSDHGPGHPECIDVLLYLNAEGEDELFLQGFRQLFEQAENQDQVKAKETLGKIVAGMRQIHDSSKLLQVEKLAATYPSLQRDPMVQNDLAYLSLLLDQPLDKATSDALISRLDKNPHEFAYRVTRALQLMKTGVAWKAYDLLNAGEENLDVLKIAPDQQALVAMLLYQTGESDKASKLLSLIRKDKLSSQEISLMKTVFSKPPAAPIAARRESNEAGTNQGVSDSSTNSKDSLAQNDKAYQSLLLDKPLDQKSRDGVISRLEDNPHEFAFRVTRALQLMKAGQPWKAYDVLYGGEEPLDVLKMSPDQQALVAMLLYKTGESTKAIKLQSSIEKDKLSPQEISLMNAVFSKPPTPPIAARKESNEPRTNQVFSFPNMSAFPPENPSPSNSTSKAPPSSLSSPTKKP